jgi:arylsulfatase A-like enzyme
MPVPIARLRRTLVVGFRRRPRDLSLTAWVELVFLALGTIVAKWVIVSFAFSEAPFTRRLWVTLKVVPLDLLATATAASLVFWLGRRFRVPRRLRGAASFVIVAAAQLLLFATFANVEFFGSWGSPLTFDLLRLAPNLAGYILLVGVSNVSGALTIWAMVAVAGLLGLPAVQACLARTLRRPEGLRRLQLASCATMVLGACLLALPPREHREGMLRNLNLLSMFVPGWRTPHDVEAHPLSAEDEATLRGLYGPPSNAGVQALAPLLGRRPNIVLWIWESVGADHLASFHRGGRALTPNLDRMRAHGSVTFSAAYAECPLTVQTTWALLTGLRPPAMPFVFVEDGALPSHGPTLPGELRRAGYRTASFYASYTHMWATRRIFDIEPFETFEDADTFVARGGSATSGIGVNDDVIVDRSLEWISGQSPAAPFFVMLWNTATHQPYTWAGMPDEIAAAPKYSRYLAAVEHSDALLGRLYAGLTDRGRLEDTVVIVMGDHGEAFGREPRPWHWSHASHVFEDEVHVPFVIVHPSIARSQVATPCTHADLYPTLLDLAGRKVPPGLDGRSLARPMPPGPLFMRAMLWWPLAMRAGDYKLILPGPTLPPLLYNVSVDPEERDDLTARQGDTARALTSALLQWHSSRFQADPTFGYRPTVLGHAVQRAIDPQPIQPSGSRVPPPDIR